MALEHTSITYKNTINSNYLGEKIYNLLDKTFVIPSNYNYNIFEVTKEYIARPDLISYDVYNDTLYTDVICKLNGISNPFELNEGMKLIIPSPEDIMNFIIRSEEHQEDMEDSKEPIAKQKQSKRKANETIIGDSRFRINQVDGIIIY